MLRFTLNPLAISQQDVKYKCGHKYPGQNLKYVNLPILWIQMIPVANLGTKYREISLSYFGHFDCKIVYIWINSSVKLTVFTCYFGFYRDINLSNIFNFCFKFYSLYVHKDTRVCQTHWFQLINVSFHLLLQQILLKRHFKDIICILS